MPHPGPRTTASTNAISKSPPRREERYERIVTAATTLAALSDVKCQIRSVATAAGIAPSTVYRYFTSKDDLLLACLHHWLRDFSATMDASIGCSDFRQGVLEVAKKLTVSLCASPRFTEAVIRPYLYAQGQDSSRAAIVHRQVSEIFCTAMHHGQPSRLHRNVAEILTDIWVTNIVAVSQQRTTLDDLMHRLRMVVNRLQGQDEKAAARPLNGTAGSDDEAVA